MNIATAKEQIKDTVEAYLAKDESGMPKLAPSRQRPIFLVGAPGIGKTAIMEQVAQELGIGIVSYSMTHHTRQSALGLPKIVHRKFGDFEYDASEYTMSEIVASIYEYMEKSGLDEGILFLDEINCVSETLYPSMLQFLQFKTFGKHRVPDNWVIVTAGNPPEYNKSVHQFDVVTLDRLREIKVEPEYEAWKRYAVAKGLHPVVTTFLDAKRDCFYSVQTLPGGEKSFVTARAWEDLAELISLYESMGKTVNRDLVAQYLKDDDIADRFAVYYDLFNKYRSDYQIGTILTGEVSDSIRKRAKAAAFDERVALMGLMMDSLGTACADALKQESLVIELRDELRRAKPVLLDGGSLSDALDTTLEDRQRAIARKRDARTADAETLKRENLVLRTLRNMKDQCEADGASAGQDAFNRINCLYKEEVAKIDPKVKDADGKIDNAIGFIEDVFGNGREMLVFIAEMTTRQSTMQFIAHYGNDKYYAHNDELQVDTSRKNLADKIAELKLEGDASDSGNASGSALEGASKSDSMTIENDKGQSFEKKAGAYDDKLPTVDAYGPGASKGSSVEPKPMQPKKPANAPLTRADIEKYYESGEHEYGFYSMSRMVLPTDKLPGKTVLDVCCRRGKGVYKFSSKVGKNGRAIGVDWNKSYIADAKAGMDRAWHDNGLNENNMEFYVAYPEDLMSVGIGTNTMDYVYINNVFSLLCSQEDALSEFERVLKPGGTLILDTVLSDYQRDPEVLKKAREIGNSVQASVSREDIVDQLTQAGFSDIAFVDEGREVKPDEGFKKSYKVPVVETDENVKYNAVCIHAKKSE